jgi:Uncharacterized conserved protein
MTYPVSVDPALYSVYPQIRLGCLRFTAQVREPDERFWSEMEETCLPQVRAAIDGKGWSEIPGVRGSRLMYKAFGRNPGRYRVSSEALMRRVRRSDPLYRINSVVDVNNLISVRSGLSVGSYDLDRVQGEIVMRRGAAGETYPGIGKDAIDLENLLVLTDDLGAFGSSMSDSTRSMVTLETRDVLVVLHCFEDDMDLPALLEESKSAFETYADAQNVEMWIV